MEHKEANQRAIESVSAVNRAQPKTSLESAETTILHTTNDSYWADGGDGSGKNMLGKLLMELRTELRQATTTH